jgi:epoxyqueuosine reductase
MGDIVTRAESFSAADLTARIREQARRLGFFKVGIAKAGRLPNAERLERWLEQGMHGRMAYMERQAEKRRDPAAILPHVRSIIVAAMNYCSVAPPSHPDGLHGRISRYAWGEDYHTVVSARLEALSRFVQELAPGTRTASYVDAGPVMEKVWGAQSALGWMGKHSNLIARELGSWFFLGVLLLDLELACDTPARDHCGSCTRCMTVCPTGAIVAPYTVDARLCISYLTIELRGSIPRELRPLIGNRIFGCDDCQEACPWNRFAVKTSEPAFSPRAGLDAPDLAAFVGITPQEFKMRFHNSPVLRAKRDGFVRNVVVALGNSGRPEAAGPLAAALHDPSALVRTHAAWALGQLRTARSAEILREALAREFDPAAHAEIVQALAEFSEKRDADSENCGVN